jgi:hypothetical protein
MVLFGCEQDERRNNPQNKIVIFILQLSYESNKKATRWKVAFYHDKSECGALQLKDIEPAL